MIARVFSSVESQTDSRTQPTDSTYHFSINYYQFGRYVLTLQTKTRGSHQSVSAATPLSQPLKPIDILLKQL